ncbi:unnamed protein product [Protopolystoma xenopodis]|uniref:Uncharacterized protein n=1 Tax=Protopolystoma xenopodis TaxID=117903 RepID=A0A3S5ARL7_9PLAT|nr:unnamed protein product [Protopolystoma xenopodis]
MWISMYLGSGVGWTFYPSLSRKYVYGMGVYYMLISLHLANMSRILGALKFIITCGGDFIMFQHSHMQRTEKLRVASEVFKFVGMDIKRMTFFSAVTALIGIPTGLKVISWVSMLTSVSVGLGYPIYAQAPCVFSAVEFKLCFFPMYYFGMCVLPPQVCVYDTSFYWMNGVCTLGRFLSSLVFVFLCIFCGIR